MTKRILLFLLPLLLTAQFAIAQRSTLRGEGEVVKQTIPMDALHGIGLTIHGELILTQGATQSVMIEAQQNVIDNIKKNVKSGYWAIEFEKDMRDVKDIKIYVTVPDLDEVDLVGSGKISTTNYFKNGKNKEINVAGSGHVYFGMETDGAEINLSGSGDIDLKGTANRIEINISGSGDVDASDLKSKSCEVAISGSGDASVTVDSALEAAISGSGDITYAGAANVEASISGSGTVRKR